MGKKKYPAIMIAAIKSGSGKTAFTCALLKTLKDRGLNPCAFKCGQDYIDPKFHQKVLKVPSENLDSFFSGEEHLKNLYGRSSKKGGISVIEGAMGLYDGLGGISESGSAYEMASILQVPVILVIDAHGMGRSMIPLLAGVLSYDKNHLIKGVILNKTSGHFYKTIAPVVEEELGLPVLGYLPKDPAFVMESRHLGLKLPDEIESIERQVEQGAAILEESVSMDRLLKIAKNAGEIEEGKKEREQEPKIRLAVARDEAFCFYYEENLRILRQKGAELLYFSPIHDQQLPEDIDALLLGGGYPELYAKELEKNESMRKSIQEAILGGMPSLAECGGFMYLHDSIYVQEKEKYKMCQILPDSCYNTALSFFR